MDDMQPSESAQTELSDLEPADSTPSQAGPVFALQGEIPSATVTTRAGLEDR